MAIEEQELCFEIRKNKFSVIRVRRTNYEGNDLLDVRVFSEDMNGNATPTRKGISLQFERLPELLAALRKIETAGGRAAEETATGTPSRGRSR